MKPGSFMGLDPVDSWLVLLLIIALTVGIVLEVLRLVYGFLDRREFRRRNQAHPAAWDER